MPNKHLQSGLSQKYELTKGEICCPWGRKKWKCSLCNGYSIVSFVCCIICLSARLFEKL